MKLIITKTKEELGRASAEHAAALINSAIKKQGYARILLSTGASQFPFFDEFVKQDVDWNKVEMFHLDEYVGISENHPASFKRYLLDRFVLKVKPGKAHLINGQKPPEETISELTALLNEKPIDVGLIGIGENAHIAFNDPPADFNDEHTYKVVTLDRRCLQQQIGEGWFKNIEETYKQAISMTCSQIMKCKSIISVVPYKVKADAVFKTLTNELTPVVPATLLKQHPDFTLYCDSDSSSLLTKEIIDKYNRNNMKKRYVIVGASYRCYTLFVTNVVEKGFDQAEITGIYDINRTRCNVFKQKIGDSLTIYDDFDEMLDKERPDAVVVTTSDLYHHEYIVRALDKGYNVISEKPITNTYERCLAIREAEKRNNKQVIVLFNMRFSPIFVALKKIIATGKLGKIYQIIYNHNLDRNHGADYFRRWHRYMKNSEGLLLHKSTHHFDIINWMLEDEPQYVSALGNRVFFGNPDKYRATSCRNCNDKSCTCYNKSQTGELDEALYFNAEFEDGYIRDTCAFKPDTDIYDNMSVSVQYKNGTLLSYTLNCFSVVEGCRIKFIGENGVLEFDNTHIDKDDNLDYNTIYFQALDGTRETFKVKKLVGTHAGSDEQLIKMEIANDKKQEDRYNQCADSYAGFVSAMIGVAGNESIRTGKTVDVSKYLEKLK